MTIHRPIAKQEDLFPDLWSLILSVGAILILIVLAFWMLSTQYYILPDSQATDDPLGVSQTEFIEETGVRIVRVALVAGGGMLDLRYQVVDPDKAIVMHDEDSPPGFLDHATGQLLNIPRHDHADIDLHTGIIYHELIMNSDGILDHGSVVSVIVGESRLGNVVIQ